MTTLCGVGGALRPSRPDLRPWRKKNGGELAYDRPCSGPVTTSALPRHGIILYAFITKHMSMDINRVTLVGNVARLPNVAVRGERTVANFPLATNYRYRTPKGEVKSTPQYHNIAVWGGLANLAAKSLKKGEKLFIDGRIKYDQWEDDQGKKHEKTVVVAQSMIFLSGKKKKEEPVSEATEEDVDAEDVPEVED